ncbi:hypothetical protein NLX86_06710 [Streptomyces sp. A3M-1-3]|uniref:hypothetical protein n=1 Tax=Streptomyces sp. A3M-1-3 TaxID=2962044 RepID=UPI0020B7E745|nr:hypothetical protein [Streptomyces sp. A3M-1-3]MCP3817838.1 hypothetical protein [Streptomyces sp. A3M-1-3]
MPDLLAGTTVKALDTPSTQSDVEGSSYDFTITTFGTASTTGTYADCAVTFTAPTSGRVEICTTARMINSTTAGTLVSPETRTGSTIGSGTIVEGASDGIGTSHYGASFARTGVTHVLSGLTPGSAYNTRLLHRVSGASTGTVALRELSVKPLS